ncbi:L-serine/L-threonine ammonia-lyase [Geosmithia morbida]|uniref:L-serine ammonia-lyase n=1 Tax=Geosmithia morbida TaxID=1094350 RepID=A0A9P4YMD8_9HYPO|nr:L-serine/L-threonine ammonia-lyase [Geosmithia morbida]KAF4119631.1 L-serine/L-threonine ammonia-lyase [Geosmithia morbida]
MGSVPVVDNVKIPWIKTPCIYSPEVSRAAGCNIYLKLDNLQPSGSFKSRGVGNLMTRAMARGTPDAHFYCSSEGNAGLACATCANTLGRPATIAVPTTVSPLMKKKLLALGAAVHEVGSVWSEADAYLRGELLANDPAGVYVPPFDHPDIWDGVASVVGELREQLAGVPLHAVVCSVGGGGLVNGLMKGVDEESEWPPAPQGQGPGRKPTVLAVETVGADSLNASVRAGEHVSLPGITSIAQSLGASRVSDETWRWWLQRGSGSGAVLVSHALSDADAAVATVRFADDTRQMVEVACGASVAVAYNGDLRRRVGQDLSDEEWAACNVVVEVCGGSAVSLDVLEAYRRDYAASSSIKLD